MNKPLKTLCRLPVWLLAWIHCTLAAQPQEWAQTSLRFSEPANHHKLPRIMSNDIVRDPMGFVWLATDDGLYRFDGEDARVFRPDPHSTGNINHHVVNRLLLDASGMLWVGTEQGLDRYDFAQDRFEPLASFVGDSTLSDDRIRVLFEDSTGRIWIGTRSGGVNLLSADRQTLKTVPSGDARYIHDFAQTAAGQLLVASKSGLYQFNPMQNELSMVAGPWQGKNITRLYPIAENRWLLGTSKGLFEMSLPGMAATKLLPDQLGDKMIVDILPYGPFTYLLTTRRSGVYLFDLQQGFARRYVADASDSDSLADNQTGALEASDDGLIWLATNNGVNLLKPAQQRFGHIKPLNSRSQCLAGNTVYALLPDRHDQLWIGSFGQGLNRVDLQTGQCQLYVEEAGRLLKHVVTVYQDVNDDIWVGTLGNGVLRYNRQADSFEGFDPRLPSSGLGLPNNITSITGDGQGKIWIGTYTQGVFEYDGELRRVPLQHGNTKVKAIGALAYDATDKLWIATASKGLWLKQSGRQAKPIEHEQLPALLWSVNLDRHGDVWLGSKGEGAFVYQPDTGQVRHFSTSNGLLNNVVLNVQQDSEGYYWLFTDKGLSRLTMPQGQVSTYLAKDGLQSDTFTTGGYFDPQTQLLWTGGINGINRFAPADIDEDATRVPVVLTSFELFYKPVALRHRQPRSPLTQAISQTREVRLGHQQNVFAFGFSAMAFLAPEQVNYAFKLDGYDTDWNVVSSDRRYANYTNIDPGEYTFRVKATDSGGRWSTGETHVKITVATPWWQTGWAWAGYVLLLLLSVYLVVMTRTRLLLKRAARLERSVEERTAELAQEKNKVEQLLDIKQQELTNVSHEFRTPLTLILGPLAQLIDSNKDEQTLNRLNTIQRNSFRLLRMVDQLLNLETYRVDVISRTKVQLTAETIGLLARAFEPLAREKRLDWQVGEMADVCCRMIPDALDKIVLNLMSNALKYTPSGGTVRIDSTLTAQGQLQIRVSDSGIGIAPDKMAQVFKRYQRVHEEGPRRINGAGIGLALVKDLVEIHKGSIQLDSTPGQGTTFTVLLPVTDEAPSQTEPSQLPDNALEMELMSMTETKEDTDTSSREVSLPLEGGTTVLVVEDNPEMLAHVAQCLADNYTVLTANDGEQGLAVAIEQVPDLIVSDVMMPGMDGYDLTQALRRHPVTNHIPVILLTARGDKDSRLKGWDNQADEYLTKPFDARELLMRAQNLLNIRAILKKRFGETAFEVVEQTEHSEPQAPEDDLSRQQQQLLEQLNKTLSDCFEQSSLSIADLAGQMAMSERQLYRKLKSVLDTTPADYLRRYRLEQGKQLLEEGKSASYVALEVGFSSQSHFGKCFKAQYGESPGEFKKRKGAPTA